MFITKNKYRATPTSVTGKQTTTKQNSKGERENYGFVEKNNKQKEYFKGKNTDRICSKLDESTWFCSGLNLSSLSRSFSAENRALKQESLFFSSSKPLQNANNGQMLKQPMCSN